VKITEPTENVGHKRGRGASVKGFYEDLDVLLEQIYSEGSNKAVSIHYTEIDGWGKKIRDKEKAAILLRSGMGRRGWKVSIHLFPDHVEVRPVRLLTPEDSEWKRMNDSAQARYKKRVSE
jgi:hypothetical protein